MRSKFATFCAAPVLAYALAAVATLGLCTPSDNPPDAESVLARAVEAGGGVDDLAKLQNRHVKGTLKLPAMSLSAPFDVWQARPNLMLTKVESEAIGTMSSGTDGQTCWENSAMQGPRVLTGVERARALREADPDFLLNWRKYFTQVEGAGSDTVQGRPAWKLLMTPTEGNVETWWFDAESGLPVKQDLKLTTEMGEIPVTVWLSDYREVDGVQIPFLARQSLMNGLQVITMVFETVAHNVQLPAGCFELPADIVALKAKEASGQ